MAVAALVLGILGFIVFAWLGPLLGGLWAAGLMTDAAIKGSLEAIVWPIWALGIGIGVFLPLVAVILGAIAMGKDQSKGVALGGLVVGLVSAIGGLVLTLTAVFGVKATASLGDNMVSDPQAFQQQMQQLQQQLNDPAVQQQLQQQLQQLQQGPGQPPPQQVQPVPMQPVPPPPPQPGQPQAPPPQPVPAQPGQAQPMQPVPPTPTQ